MNIIGRHLLQLLQIEEEVLPVPGERLPFGKLSGHLGVIVELLDEARAEAGFHSVQFFLRHRFGLEPFNLRQHCLFQFFIRFAGRGKSSEQE